MTKEDNIRAILETHFAGFREDLIESAVKMIMRFEERHGRWIEASAEDPCEYRCSECGWLSDDEYHYCPNCGSRMDLEGDAE